MRDPTALEHTNARGERVRILGWEGEGDLALLVHHGLGEHIGRYQTFGDHLPGLPVWGYDCRGHGPYTDRRGHAMGLAELASDLSAMIPVLLEKSGAARAVLLGHSMGAATALTYLTSHPPHPALVGVVLAAPPVAVELDLAQRVKVRVGRALARFAPAMTLDAGLPKTGISSLPEEVQRYLDDPLVHPMVSLELARSLVDDAPGLVEAARAIELPVLLLHGQDDPIALPIGSEQLHRTLPHSTCKTFAGARHEVHHDALRHVDAYFTALQDFIGGFAEAGMLTST